MYLGTYISIFLIFLKYVVIVLSLQIEITNDISDFLEIFVPEDDLCTLEIVESIPQGLIYNNSKPNLSTFQVS